MTHIDELKKLYRYRHDEDVSECEKENPFISDRYQSKKAWLFLRIRYDPETDEKLLTKNEYTFYRNRRNNKYYCTWRTRHGNTEMMIITDDEYHNVKKGGHLERDEYIDKV